MRRVDCGGGERCRQSWENRPKATGVALHLGRRGPLSPKLVGCSKDVVIVVPLLRPVSAKSLATRKSRLSSGGVRSTVTVARVRL